MFLPSIFLPDALACFVAGWKPLMGRLFDADVRGLRFAFHQRLISGSKHLALRAEESLGLRSGLLAGE